MQVWGEQEPATDLFFPFVHVIPILILRPFMNRSLTAILVICGFALLVLTLIAVTGVPGKMDPLSFGEDIKLSGAAFDQKRLDQISKLTGHAPPTEGMSLLLPPLTKQSPGWGEPTGGRF